VSAFSEPGRPIVDDTMLTSAFQRRMLRNDAASALPRLLREAAGRTDLVLWDLVDERLGFFPGQDGTAVTNSVEIQRLVAAGEQLWDQPVPFGTRRHLRQFEKALREFVTLLTEIGLIGRTVLVAPQWASATEDGSATPSSFGLEAGAANEMTRHYVDLIAREAGVPVLTTDPASTTAGSTHIWGVAPFHYTDAVYQDLASQLQELAAKLPSRGTDTTKHGIQGARLRAGADGTLLAEVVGGPDERFAFHLFRNGERLEARPYGHAQKQKFSSREPGTYICRIFSMDASGSRTAISTNAVAVP
jgi:hypothetical protein